MSPYQHSAENTCFGIIKLHSKASTSTGEGELAPLSTENLCAENKHSGHAAADHSGITNALESPKWKWMQYTCGARSNNGPLASERYHNSTNHLLMLWWGYNGGELVDYPVCICLHSGEFSIMLLSFMWCLKRSGWTWHPQRKRHEMQTLPAVRRLSQTGWKITCS